MVLFNYSTKELTAKIVYYGPGLCGKTTNLQFIYSSLAEDKRGRMLSLSTQTDRTLYFDFLPVELGEIRGMKTRIQLYTVPGQVFYNETRKMVLKGVDGIVFVADAQSEMAEANLESYANLEENLRGHDLDLADMPMVLQFNKRDLPSIQSVEEMNAALNRYNSPFYEAIATTGIGVHDTLKAINKLVLRSLSSKGSRESTGDGAGMAPEAEPAAAAPAAGSASVITDAVAAPQPETPAGQASPSTLVTSWDESEIENELEKMDVTEIQGLLDEVEGMSAAAGATGAAGANGGIQSPAVDPSAASDGPSAAEETAEDFMLDTDLGSDSSVLPEELGLPDPDPPTSVASVSMETPAAAAPGTEIRVPLRFQFAGNTVSGELVLKIEGPAADPTRSS